MKNPLETLRNRVPLLRELPIEVTAVSMVAFCVALGFGIVAPVIPAFAREFGVSAFAASSVVSVFAGMRLAGAPLAGKFVDLIGERRTLSFGLAVVSISSFTAGLSQNFWQLLVLRGLGGLGSVAFSIASMAVIIRVVEPGLRGRASSAWSGGFLLGGLAGPAVGGIFAAISLRAPFFVYAVTLVFASLVSWYSLRNAHLTESVATSEEVGTWKDVWKAFRNRAYAAAVGVNFSNGFVRMGILNAIAPLFVVEALNSQVSLASTGFLFSAIGQFILISKAGRWADSIGRKPVLIAGTLLSGVGMITMGGIENISAYFLAMFVLGVAGAFLSSATPAVLGDATAGQPRGPVISAYQMSSDLGGIFGPVFGGWLLDFATRNYGEQHAFEVPFIVGGVIAASSVILVLRMKETLIKVAPTKDA
jgi:MFS family permease